MSLKKLLLMVFVSCLLGACASTSDSGSSEGNAAASAESVGESADAEVKSLAEKEEEICKVRAITGSRFKQKTCMTQEQWDRMAYETKKMLDEDTRSKPTNY